MGGGNSRESILNQTHYNLLMDALWYGNHLNPGGMQQYSCRFFAKPLLVESIENGYENLYLVPADLCNTEDAILFGRRSVRPFCPETCGCKTTVKNKYTYNGVLDPWTLTIAEATECPY